MLEDKTINRFGRRIYGLIIAISIIVWLEYYDAKSWEIIISIWTTLMTIAIAEIYVKTIAHSTKKADEISQYAFKEIMREEGSVLWASLAPTIALLLEVFWFVSQESATLMIEIYIIGVLFIFWYIFWMVAEKSFFEKIIIWIISSSLWVAVVSIKIILTYIM